MQKKGVCVSPRQLRNQCNDECVDSLRVEAVKEELKTVINTMGPNSTDSNNNDTDVISSTETDNQKDMVNKEYDTSENLNDITDYSTSKDISQSLPEFEPTTPDCKPCLCPFLKPYDIPDFPCSVDKNCTELDQGKTDKVQKLCKWLAEKNILRASTLNRSKVPIELYKMNVIKEGKDGNGVPKQFVFNLVEGVPKPETNTVGVNTSLFDCPNKWNTQYICKQEYSSCKERPSNLLIANGMPKKKFHKNTSYVDGSGGKIDVYYFDHGNSAYFRTTDCPPILITELLAEKTEQYTTKFWAQIFGTAHIGFAFFTTFIIQLLRFLLQSLIRPLTVGVAQIISDYFFKPFLTILFNAVIQPPLIFLYNVATSIRDLLDPIAEGIGYFLREIAVVFQAIRLVDVKKRSCCDHFNSEDVSGVKCNKR